jgi:hypothetical protein
MAPRKQNPIQDIADTVSAWLGGNRGTVNPQVQRVTRDLGTVAKTIDTYGTGGLGQAALRDVKNFQQGGSLPTNLAKTAAVNAAAAAVGAAAAKVAGKAVAATGIPARVANKVTGRKVVVHASPVTGLKNIEPRLGSNQLPEQSVVFGWDPRRAGMDIQITRSAGRYVSKDSGQPAGSIYLAAMKKGDIVTPPQLSSSGQVVSRSSAKVVKEIPVSGKTFAEVDAELRRQLRRAGSPVRADATPVRSAVAKTGNTVKGLFQTKAQKTAARRRNVR